MAKKLNRAPLVLQTIEPWVVEIHFPEDNNSTEGEDEVPLEEEAPVGEEEATTEDTDIIEFLSPEIIDYN